MIKTLSAILILAFVALVSYHIFFKEEPLSQRDALEDGVSQIKAQRDLKPEEEILLKLQLAIIDFTVTKTHPPDNLAELIPTYFDSVPINPITNKPYQYTRTGAQYKLGTPATEEQMKQQALRLQNENSAVKSDFYNPNSFREFDFVYDPAGKRDPFLQFDFSPKVSLLGEMTPLQKYALGQLKLTAVLLDIGREPKAIVEDANGKGYTVVPGTLIGNSRGVVIGIEQTKIKILETSVDFAGNERQVVRELKLNAGKERSSSR